MTGGQSETAKVCDLIVGLLYKYFMACHHYACSEAIVGVVAPGAAVD